MNERRPRWIDIDSPSRVLLRTAPTRPRWHHILDDISAALEVGWLVCAPWIAGGIMGGVTYWLLTR